MNERSPLLHPSPDAPSVVVHNVQHDATAQMGTCCMGDGIKTAVLCEICSAWICKSHEKIHVSNREPFDRETYIPCISILSVAQHRYSPVCPMCAKYEERPSGYPSYYVNTKGKVCAVATIAITIIVIVAVFIN